MVVVVMVVVVAAVVGDEVCGERIPPVQVW